MIKAIANLILVNPALLIASLLIWLGVSSLVLREDLLQFRRHRPTPMIVALPSAAPLVPESAPGRHDFDLRINDVHLQYSGVAYPTSEVKAVVEKILLSNKAPPSLRAENYYNLNQLLLDLESRQAFDASDIAVKSLFKVDKSSIGSSRDYFYDFASTHSVGKTLHAYVIRKDYLGARRHVRRMSEWIDEWNVPPTLTRTNLELQGFINSVLRLDALFHDVSMFFAEEDAALQILNNTISETSLEGHRLHSFLASNSPELRAWGAYLTASSELRKLNFAAAESSFMKAAEKTKNRKLRDIAVLGAIRTHFWRAKVNKTTETANNAAISSLKKLLGRRSLLDDAEFYESELRSGK